MTGESPMSKLQNFELVRIEFQPDFMNFQDWRLALFWELVPRTWNFFFALTFCLRWWGLNRFSILRAKKNISLYFCSSRDQKICSVGLFSPCSASGPNLPVREFGVTWRRWFEGKGQGGYYDFEVEPFFGECWDRYKIWYGQSRGVGLSFAQKNIKIGSPSSEIQLLEVGDHANFKVFHGFPLVNQRWFTKGKSWKTLKFAWSPTSRSCISELSEPILIIFCAKDSPTPLLCPYQIL